MSNSLSVRNLQLTLESQSVVPSNRCWRLHDGYIRVNTWTPDGDVVSIGLSGPGDLLTPLGLEWEATERVCLTRASVEEVSPSNEELAACLEGQMAQAITLLQIGRLRPVDARLLHLFRWIGSRFGIVNSQGTIVSLQEMNLTHRALAELTGMTRVSVTKALSRFKSRGLIVTRGDLDLLLPHASQGLPWTLRAQPCQIPPTARSSR
jgi:CRP-like cAMP-binding protein